MKNRPNRIIYNKIVLVLRNFMLTDTRIVADSGLLILPVDGPAYNSLPLFSCRLS
jgi:hypothetical protein